MHYKKAFPSNYLKACDVTTPVTYTIKSVAVETMRDGNEKLAITFVECKPKFIVNVTNANRLGEAFGDDTDNWINQRIVLCSERVPFGPDLVPAIRVKIPAEQAAPDTKRAGPPTAKMTKAQKAQAAQAPAEDPFADLDDDDALADDHVNL